MTDAERIEQLEAEIAYLRSELGLALDQRRVGVVGRALRLSPNEARISLALYHCSRGALSASQLADATERRDAVREYDQHNIAVHVSHIRAKRGREFIVTLPNRTYALGPKGQAKVREALEADLCGPAMLEAVRAA